jgi:hypothetical protein
MLRTALGLVLSAAVAVSSTIAAGRVAACPRAVDPASPTAVPASGASALPPAVRVAAPDASVLVASPSSHTSLELSILGARIAAEAVGWKHEETSRVTGRELAFVRYGSPASAQQGLFELVGATGAPLRLQASTFRVVPPKAGGALWDLRGDGARFAIIETEECGANCQPAEHHVFEARGDTWARPASAPARPTEGRDEDHDGIPEFPVALAHLKIASCSRVACGPTYELAIEVEGLESWDGQRFARDLLALKPLYMGRMAAAGSAGRAARARTDKASVCPIEALQAASNIFVYLRVAGVDAAQALAEADKTMAGYTTEACNHEGPQAGWLSDVRPWSVLRAELFGTAVPQMTRGPFTRKARGGW